MNEYAVGDVFPGERPSGARQSGGTDHEEKRGLDVLAIASFACACGLFLSGRFCFLAGRLAERKTQIQTVSA
jgi:hypothetical protein